VVVVDSIVVFIIGSERQRTDRAFQDKRIDFSSKKAVVVEIQPDAPSPLILDERLTETPG
jgi:hypothetical protein